MNSIRKIISSAMCLAFAGIIAGCGSTASATSVTETELVTETTPANDGIYKIGICQFVKHKALDAATEGFENYLIQRLGDRVKFVTQNAQGDATNCQTIINEFKEAGNYDLIMANATPALQAASSIIDIPIVGTSVTHYAVALERENWTGSTGINITGTSDLAPIDRLEDMLIELVPDTETVGIIYTENEANSKFQVMEFESELEKDGLPYMVYPISNENDVETTLEAAIKSCNVLYIPTDNMLATKGEMIKNKVVPAKVPVITGEEGICSECGIATLAIDYYKLGEQTGEMAYNILVENMNPAITPIQYSIDAEKKYNKNLCIMYNIEVPNDYIPL